MSPPFAKSIISISHFANIIFSIWSICQCFNNIRNRKPPLIVVDGLSNFLVLENSNFCCHCFSLVTGARNNCVCTYCASKRVNSGNADIPIRLQPKAESRSNSAGRVAYVTELKNTQAGTPVLLKVNRAGRRPRLPDKSLLSLSHEGV